MATRVTRAWYIDKLGKMGIVERATNAVSKDGYTSDWTSITAVKATRIYAISRDSDISINELTNTFNQIPGEYHEALTYKAIATGYKDPRNLNIEAAQYFDMEYEKGVKQGKKFSKSNYTDVGSVRQQDF
jgi:hypothetical protein